MNKLHYNDDESQQKAIKQNTRINAYKQVDSDFDPYGIRDENVCSVVNPR